MQDASLFATGRKSIAFVIPEARIGSCGVTDYVIRMAAALARQGIKASVLPLRGCRESGSVSTSEGDVPIEPLSAKSAFRFEILAVQYVPGFTPDARGFMEAVSGLKHPAVHLMLHEIWMIPMPGTPLGIKDRIKAILQKRQLRKFIQACAPTSVATSNRFYQSLLIKAGIQAAVSPMPANIPLGHSVPPPDSLELPSWWSDRGNRFLWISFGSLYTADWDCGRMFKEIRELEDAGKARFAWVFCGKLHEHDRRTIRMAAEANGFGDEIFFTGPVDAEAVDWWLRQADAAFAGSPGEVWPKSGGLLASVERRLPVLLPRGWHQMEIEPGGAFATTPSEILRLASDVRKSPDSFHFRTLDEVTHTFISALLIRQNPQPDPAI
jgi:hypothetical protein